ncbi:MAG: LemA family protein [Bacteroidales bacterium]|nr:LemA family protein [Bacteroidales bacterium]
MIIAIIIAAVVFLIIVGLYNSLVRKKNDAENAFATIDVMLKKRYDLIPNLVTTVKEYMKHEHNTLSEITDMRSKAVQGGLSEDERVALDNKISKHMAGIMVAVENYPDLKANQNFLQLQAAWNEIEEQISAARRTFNAAITSFNNAVETFPSNIMANIMGYKRKQLFEIPEVEKQNISARDLFNS